MRTLYRDVVELALQQTEGWENLILGLLDGQRG